MHNIFEVSLFLLYNFELLKHTIILNLNVYKIIVVKQKQPSLFRSPYLMFGREGPLKMALPS